MQNVPFLKCVTGLRCSSIMNFSRTEMPMVKSLLNPEQNDEQSALNRPHHQRTSLHQPSGAFQSGGQIFHCY